MFFRLVTLVGLTVFALAGSSLAQSRTEARLTKLGEMPRTQLYGAALSPTADSCIVRHDYGLMYRISGWLTGNELYKSYLDPSETCADTYPFSVTAVCMTLIFDDTTLLTVSVDVETVDTDTYPGCPIPGSTLTISSEYDVAIPSGGGLFEVWIPLDSPVIVNGPFFAGFFIANTIDTSAHAGLITDSTTVPCTSFNIWDPNVGWVDLTNNGYFNFPGRLVLFASGFPGGGSVTDPPPQAEFIAPIDGSVLYGETELWTRDISSSTIIDYASFSYSSTSAGGGFVEIGTDHDGTAPLRNGVSSTETGTGFSIPWTFSGLLEDIYTVRATIYDTLGRSSVAEIAVQLDPTPPIPKIMTPDQGAAFCSPLELTMSCSDENVSFITVEHKPALDYYSILLTALDQNHTGDANGDPNDGNTQISGEFGDFYNAPVSAAVITRLWYDRGYTSVMQDSDSLLTMVELAEVMAAEFSTRENLGTLDEDVYLGLQRYFDNHGGGFKIDYKRKPTYFDLRRSLEQEGCAVMVAVGGDPAFWMALDGFIGWKMFDSTWHLRMVVPQAGNIIDIQIRRSSDLMGGDEIGFGGTWHPVELMITLRAEDWDVPMELTGVDAQGSDGWSLQWMPSDLTSEDHMYFRTATEDATQCEGADVVLLEYNCSLAYEPGDYDNDGEVNLSDLYHLIHYITTDGPPPAGGPARADCNCDNLINVADIVYYLNYLYGYTGPPCH